MEGDFEGDFENSVGERDLRYVNWFHARGGGLKFLWWICLVCLLLKALKKHLPSRCFYSKRNKLKQEKPLKENNFRGFLVGRSTR